jgi:hypothetical protein
MHRPTLWAKQVLTGTDSLAVIRRFRLWQEISISGNAQVHVPLCFSWRWCSSCIQLSLKPSTEYPWMLTCKLRWSKNVCEHHDCPHHVMLGSMNPQCCVMLGLAIFLEEWIERRQGRTSQWLFTDGQTKPNSPEKEIKMKVTRCKGVCTGPLGRL